MLRIRTAVAIIVLPSLLAGIAFAAQDRYSLQVPGGLAFADFKGYEDGRVISVSHNGDKVALIVGNPAMIDAYKSGIPGNGKPFPTRQDGEDALDGKEARGPTGRADAPGALHDVDLMVKDSKKFADSGGWGYAEFEYDPATETFRPGDTNNSPPQEHDAKCGFACHTIVADKDYVFTHYPAL